MKKSPVFRFVITISFILFGISPTIYGEEVNSENTVEKDARSSYMQHFTTKGTFLDVRENLEFAITNLGMVINNVSRVGNMLSRTGADLGEGKKIFVEAEALEFCSAVVSREMMQADPHNIIFCPYIIAIYVLPDDPETVHLSYRRPLPVGNEASKESLRAVESLLEGILLETVDY